VDRTVTTAGTHHGAVAGAIPRQPPGFLPRPHLLGQLNRADQGVSVLTGVPGVGKSELAAAYARAKLAAGWRLVAWVNAGNPGSLLNGLAAVAEAAGLPADARRDRAYAGRAVRRWLEADGQRCLLVFDDADDPDLLRPFVPDGAARVLIISPRRPVAQLGTTVLVDVFSPDEALAVLAGRTALDDEAGAASLAAELRYLPLPLAQAATVIAGRQLGYRAYRKRLRVLPVEDRLIPARGQPYPHGVAEAVLLSLDEARTSDPTGVYARVMEIMAVVSPSGLRRDLLHAAGQAGVLAGRRRGSRVRPTLVDAMLERLAERSLLTLSVDGQAVVAHRLVTRVVRDELARQERLMAACRAAAYMLDLRAGALEGSPDRAAVRDLTEQLTALLENVAGLAAEVDDDMAGLLLSLRFWALYHLNELGDSSSQAIAVGEQLVADLEQTLGPHHRDTLGSRNNLAAAYQAAGRFAEAIPLFQQTLATRARLLGPDHPETLTSQHNLAAAYQAAGRFAEAIPLLERTLAAREQVLGADHPSTVNSRRNLADALAGQAEAGQAE
jgi:hypothetical protein